ncbi:MAG: hypothetical protein K2Y35_18910 [Burkholderiales bacterium]|nr:hypothetical protein [Burkholderiales bacterium]
MNLKRIFLASFGAVAAVAAVPAGAALNWNFANGTGNCTASTNAGCWGNTITRTSTGGSTNFSATAEAYSSTGTGGVIQDAYLASWSGGLGVANRNTNSVDPNEGTPRATTAPEHSIDSQGTNAVTTTNGTGAVYDSVLFAFANAVTLTQVTLGWAAYDSDISVLAWVGPGSPPTGTNALDLGSKTYASLVSSGWALVGNYMDVAGTPAQSAGGSSGTYTTLINGAANADNTTGSAVYSSQYWLVGAYNPVFDGSSWTAGNDFVKLSSVAGVKTPDRKVPEPASAALVALSVCGVLAMRGRRRQMAR